jgi:hypothetical protein
MSLLTYEGKLPSPTEFAKALSQIIQDTNPVEDLLLLSRQMWAFEQNYKLSSADMYQQYQRGALGDDEVWLEWASTYQTFNQIKRQLELALMRAAIEPIKATTQFELVP